MAIRKIVYRKCSGCGTCVMSCPMDVFRMDRESKRPAVVYPEDCMVCGFCKVHCPERAIKLTRTRSGVVLAWG